MRWLSSLTFRLTIHLFLGLFLASLGTYVVFLLLSLTGQWSNHMLYWDDLARARARNLVIEFDRSRA